MKIYVPRTVTVDGREVEALVPIEAEEETLWEGSLHLRTQTRLVTPWRKHDHRP